MIVGILLAAGASTRFGGDKLLAELSNGQCVAEVSYANLRPAVDRLIAVVRPDASALAQRLAAAGAEISVFSGANQGIGASIAHGVAKTSNADGWLIALGDMPLIDRRVATRIAESLCAGAAIAIPVAHGQRGHPVGFAHHLLSELTALNGDIGARIILAKHATDVMEVPVSNANCWLDIDNREGLETAKQLFNRS